MWCTNFICITLTNEAVCYSRPIISLYDRSTVASGNSSFITSSLAIRTPGAALPSVEAIPQNLILHLDQGNQFTSAELVQRYRKPGISQSIGHVGCPCDSVPMECYYNTLRTELIYQYRFETAAELIMLSQSSLTIGIIRYAHTRITDIRSRLKRGRNIPLSSDVTKSIDHDKIVTASGIE